MWPDDNVILFDGVCVFCSSWVRFVAKRDVTRRFRFTAIQSPYGQAMARALGIDPDDPDTNAVIIDGDAYKRSGAAIAVLSTLPYWRWTSLLNWVPRTLRDCVYTFIATNRYRILGKLEVCDIRPHWLEGRVLIEAPRL